MEGEAKKEREEEEGFAKEMKKEKPDSSTGETLRDVSRIMSCSLHLSIISLSFPECTYDSSSDLVTSSLFFVSSCKQERESEEKKKKKKEDEMGPGN